MLNEKDMMFLGNVQEYIKEHPYLVSETLKAVQCGIDSVTNDMQQHIINLEISFAVLAATKWPDGHKLIIKHLKDLNPKYNRMPFQNTIEYLEELEDNPKK